MLFPVTALFSGINGVLNAVFSVPVALTRKATGLLHGSNLPASASKTPGQYEGQVRAHQNMTEYMPSFLLLLASAELNKSFEQNVLIAIGSVFTALRVAHSTQLAAPNKVPVKVRMYSYLSQVGILAAFGATLAVKAGRQLARK